jgi:hypothetical protein
LRVSAANAAGHLELVDRNDGLSHCVVPIRLNSATSSFPMSAIRIPTKQEVSRRADGSLRKSSRPSQQVLRTACAHSYSQIVAGPLRNAAMMLPLHASNPDCNPYATMKFREASRKGRQS